MFLTGQSQLTKRERKPSATELVQFVKLSKSGPPKVKTCTSGFQKPLSKENIQMCHRLYTHSG